MSLFEKIAENDESAFRQLFHLYLSEIRPVILTIVKEEAVVADIVQEVFLRIWLGRGQLTAIQSPRSWIFKIVYYQSFNWLRQQRTRDKYEAGFYELEKGKEIIYSTSLQISFEETRKLIKRAIQQLPPQMQKIYCLSREEGLKIAEIAEALQLSPQTVKNTLSRSLQSIRSYLEANGVIISTCLIWYSIF